ncbi:hypothetical protein [Kitasatospora sp. NPDC051914]|uniref:hypothetical protein n=1 Tax=Kitasatospora sp. NPDC051914 TaxID=3154945 RepID=UPI0034403268
MSADDEVFSMDEAQGLARVSQRAADAAQHVESVQRQSRTQVQQALERAEAGALGRGGPARKAEHGHEEHAGSAWHHIRESWHRRIGALKEREARHDAGATERAAEYAERYALEAVDFALEAVDEAEYAALRALAARLEADEAAAQSGPPEEHR